MTSEWPHLELLWAPGTCSRVTCVALEEIGLPYETRLVRFMAGEHKSPAYKALNPKGKVPTLMVNFVPITETVAILNYLNGRFPSANLLPMTQDAVGHTGQLADLCFCATTLHPLVTRIRLPTFFAGPDCARKVWGVACEAMHEYFMLVEDRLRSQAWWYGSEWSVMDAYLSWIYWRVAGAGFDVAGYPHFADHSLRNQRRPAMVRALQRELMAQEQLKTEGMEFLPPALE